MALRRLLSFAVVASALLLAGCGGGGGGGSGGVATLSGRITLRNGTTSNLSGVLLTLSRTGQTVASGPTGAFDFGTVPTGTLALRVRDAAALVTSAAVDGGNAAGDDSNDASNGDSFDDGDDNDVGDDDMDVAEVEDGEDLEIEIEVNDGVIEAVHVARTGGDDREAEVRLARTDASDDADITGEIEVESRDGGERIRAEAEHADAGRELRLVLILEGAEADLGVAAADAEGEAEWELDTAAGGVLPFGATTVSDLAGATAEIRDASSGLVLLRGTVVEPPVSAGEDSGDAESEGRALLANAAGVDGEAHVGVESRTEEGETRQKFQVEAHLPSPGTEIEVWIEDPSGSATFTKVGAFAISVEDHGELEFDTHDGDALPLGVADVADLAGRAIELRNASGGAVLFSGTIPAPIGD